MKEVIGKKSSMEEIINLHENTLETYNSLLKSIRKDNSNWNKETDARIVPIKLIIENIQTDVILLHLIKEHFADISLWEYQKFDTISKSDFLNNRLYFILLNMKGSLLIKIFLNYEHFMRLIGNHLNLKSDSINGLSKQIVNRLKLNSDFDNLIDIITYSRNTIHFGGIHTKPSKTVIYDSKKYEFIQDEHLAFLDDDSFHFLLIEMSKLMSAIINADEIKKESEIIHTYSYFTFKYE